MSNPTSTTVKGLPVVPESALGGGGQGVKYTCNVPGVGPVSVCRVLRNLGAKYPSITPKGAQAYLEQAFGVTGVSMATIKTQLYQGKSGNLGSEAPLPFAK